MATMGNKYVTTYNDHRSVELAPGFKFVSPNQRDPYKPKRDYSGGYDALSNLANYQRQAASQGFNQQQMMPGQQQGLLGLSGVIGWPFGR